jgi:hypothetical protein
VQDKFYEWLNTAYSTSEVIVGRLHSTNYGFLSSRRGVAPTTRSRKRLPNLWSSTKAVPYCWPSDALHHDTQNGDSHRHSTVLQHSNHDLFQKEGPLFQRSRPQRYRMLKSSTLTLRNRNKSLQNEKLVLNVLALDGAVLKNGSLTLQNRNSQSPERGPHSRHSKRSRSQRSRSPSVSFPTTPIPSEIRPEVLHAVCIDLLVDSCPHHQAHNQRGPRQPHMDRCSASALQTSATQQRATPLYTCHLPSSIKHRKRRVGAHPYPLLGTWGQSHGTHPFSGPVSSRSARRA